jgi:hypothetical protein
MRGVWDAIRTRVRRLLDEHDAETGTVERHG